MKPFFHIAALSAFLLASTAHAGNGPIRSVTLSSGGVAEVVRSSDVDAGGVIEIDVPLAQVDDILKSLVVLSEEARVKDISLAGPQPIRETFQTLPFTPDDLNSLAGILSSMKGSRVTLDGQMDVFTIVGVETAPDGAKSLVLLSSDKELARKGLNATTRVSFPDAAARKKIDDAVGLLADAAADGMRKVRISLGGDVSGKEVGLSYVVAAPIWKPTYKLVVHDGGKARLQAWAVLENATGEDWNDVSITLSSGRPVTLRQRLHERVWKDRGVVSAAGEDMDHGALMTAFDAAQRRSDGVASMSMAMAAPAPGSLMEMAAPAETATSDQALAMSNFTLPGVYSVRNGDTLSVPVVDEMVEATMVSTFDPASQHPKAALLIRNTSGTALPAGIMTVYDSKGGYVGDARFGDMAANGSQTSVFGTDLEMEQYEERRSEETLRSVRLVDSLLVASKVSAIISEWKVRAGGEGRTFVVEDAVPPGYRVAKGQIVEETPGGVRLKAAVKAGETATLSIRYEREVEEEMVAADPDVSRIAVWIQGAASEEVKERLRDVMDSAAELGRANAAMDQVNSRYSEIEREQGRIRGNLAEVEDETLKARWVAKMSALEDEADELDASRKRVASDVARLREKLGQKIRSF